MPTSQKRIKLEENLRFFGDLQLGLFPQWDVNLVGIGQKPMNVTFAEKYHKLMISSKTKST